jgi:hypothetical protein
VINVRCTVHRLLLLEAVRIDRKKLSLDIVSLGTYWVVYRLLLSYLRDIRAALSGKQ